MNWEAIGAVANIFLQGNEMPDEREAVPKLRYRLLMQNVTEVMLEIYTQTLVTGISPETWNTQGRTLVIRVLATSGGRWFWKNFA